MKHHYTHPDAACCKILSGQPATTMARRNLSLLTHPILKKWVLLLIFLISNWGAMAQTATAPVGAGSSGDPYQIATLNNLYWVTQNTSSWAAGIYFIQTADIDASSTGTWNAGAGFSPIGNFSTFFQGNYNGQTHSIDGLVINRPSEYYIGLFGVVSDGTIQNLNLTNTNIAGFNMAGGLIGVTIGSCTVTNCFTSGTVKADELVGGLIALKYCTGIVSNCSSSSNVTGIFAAGGLIGVCDGGLVQNSFATGNVTVNNGLAGGLIGEIYHDVSTVIVTNCYATGNVTGLSNIGGFVGNMSSNIFVSNCYSTGIVNASGTNIGGFAGRNYGTITNSFWDTETSERANSDGGTGLTTAEMKTLSTFTGAGWDFVGETTNGTGDFWTIDGTNNNGYPYLAWQSFPPPPQPMTLVFNTYFSDGTTITLPLQGIVDVTVDWGDGTATQNFTTADNHSHTYAAEGGYTVTISGSLTEFGNISYPNAEKLIRVTSFGDLGLTSLYYAFHNATNLIEAPIVLPATVTVLNSTFRGCSNFNFDIGGWDVSNVVDIMSLFLTASSFNQDIGGWDVSKVTKMRQVFRGATDFNQDIKGWDVSNVQDMYAMFLEATSFNQDIGGWDVSNVEDMTGMFCKVTSFDQDIGGWNVSNVTTMWLMFAYATAFNQDIGGWNVSNVRDMTDMFNFATSFDQDIGAWNVGNVENMTRLFANSSFNQDIGDWDVSNVKNMYAMFAFSSFNQDIGGWEVSNVENMYLMFYTATSFNQNIGGWNVSNVTNMTFMFHNATLSTENYDALLIGWSAQTLQPNVNFQGGNSKYSCGVAATARETLTGGANNWIIYDGGLNDITPALTIADPAAACGSVDITSALVITGNTNGGTLSWWEDATASSTPLADPAAVTASGTYYIKSTNSCGDDIKAVNVTLNTVTTQAVSAVGASTATANGNITSLGIPNPTAHGFCWSTSTNPTIALTTKTDNGGASATGAFTSHITGLTPNTTFYIRAYISNETCTAYGEEQEFTTSKGELTITGISGANKVYDGNTNVSLSGTATLNGHITGATDVTLDEGVNTFSSKDAGNWSITTAYTLSGPDADKYTLVQPTDLSATITAKGLLVKGITVNNKEYDGTTAASLTGGELNGIVTGDVVTLTPGTGTFASVNAGTAIVVTADGYSLTGADMANYTLAQPSDLAANITAKELTVSDAVAQDKVYDGKTDAKITNAVLNGVVSDDDVELNALVGAFANKNAADAIAVTSALTIKGADMANYTLAQPSGLAASITKAELTVTAQDAERIEGIANPEFVIEYSGFVNSEDESVLNTKPFATSIADEASAPGEYAIIVSGGVDNNYSFNYVGAVLTVTSTVGIDQTIANNVKVYPNPFVNELFIDAGHLPANASAILYDMNGRMLMNIALNGQKVYLGHLKPGVYILHVEGQAFRIVKK